MKSYPFTSQVSYDEQGLPLYDRAVDSEFLREVFAQYFSDGIFYKPASALQVSSGTGMTVLVSPGCCHIRGAMGIESLSRTLQVQAAEDSDRIDTVVARLDLSLAVRSIDLYVVKGTAAEAPQAPALTRDSTRWEIGLANLFVAKNTSTITQQRITDTRLDTTRCGVVAQTIDGLDTSAYFTQIQAIVDEESAAWQVEFSDWFEMIKGQLSTDAAGHLQNQIDELGDAIRVFSALLLASDWSGDATNGYTQTVSCPGMLAAYDTESPSVPTTGVKETDEALNEGLGVLCAAGNYGTTLDGQVSWVCYSEVPTVDLPIRLRRVVEGGTA